MKVGVFVSQVGVMNSEDTSSTRILEKNNKMQNF